MRKFGILLFTTTVCFYVTNCLCSQACEHAIVPVLNICEDGDSVSGNQLYLEFNGTNSQENSYHSCCCTLTAYTVNNLSLDAFTLWPNTTNVTMYIDEYHIEGHEQGYYIKPANISITLPVYKGTLCIAYINATVEDTHFNDTFQIRCEQPDMPISTNVPHSTSQITRDSSATIAASTMSLSHTFASTHDMTLTPRSPTVSPIKSTLRTNNTVDAQHDDNYDELPITGIIAGAFSVGVLVVATLIAGIMCYKRACMESDMTHFPSRRKLSNQQREDAVNCGDCDSEYEMTVNTAYESVDDCTWSVKENNKPIPGTDSHKRARVTDEYAVVQKKTLANLDTECTGVVESIYNHLNECSDRDIEDSNNIYNRTEFTDSCEYNHINENKTQGICDESYQTIKTVLGLEGLEDEGFYNHTCDVSLGRENKRENDYDHCKLKL